MIIKLNEKYDELPTTKRTILFLTFILPVCFAPIEVQTPVLLIACVVRIGYLVSLIK